jgi:hypothetical protein
MVEIILDQMTILSLSAAFTIITTTLLNSLRLRRAFYLFKQEPYSIGDNGQSQNTGKPNSNEPTYFFPEFNLCLSS